MLELFPLQSPNTPYSETILEKFDIELPLTRSLPEVSEAMWRVCDIILSLSNGAKIVLATQIEVPYVNIYL